MGFDEGRVVFDRPDLTYSPGQMVQGRLEFQQDKDKTFRGLYLKAKGFCETHWETRETRRVDDREEVYYEPHDAYELYFEQIIYFMGGKSGECHLRPGEHVFPFQILIPPHCPSSYEGSYGHIRYTFKFVVDRAFKIDQEKEITINVVSPYDLNKNPYCLEPLVFEFDEPYSCCCRRQGRVETMVKVPRAGFCPGETIPIEMSCTNNSQLAIDKIQCKIVENTVYRTTDDTKYLEETIAKLTKVSIPSNTSRQWQLEMVLPQMELHNIEGCNWIEIYYDFEVKISPEGCHSDTDASSRIILGHIPLRIGEPDTMVPTQQPALNLAPYPQTSPDYGVSQVFTVGNGPYPGGNGPYPGGNGPYPVGNGPYHGGNGPYPSGNGPYPVGNGPYPGGNGPYPVGNGPYPGGNGPYPSGNGPYPVGNGPYPGGNGPYPVGNGPYPGGNGPYSEGNGPHPGGNGPYPGGNGPYPGGNGPYPGENVPYPGGNGSYPVEKGPYPGVNGPNPGGNVPYPGGNGPYPGGNGPYPVGNGPYPGGNVPHPGGQLPYPGGVLSSPGSNIPAVPYPAANVPYPAGNQEKAPLLQDNFQKTPCPGFTLPAENLEKSPGTEGTGLAPQPPYNPNVESAPLLQDNNEKTPYPPNTPGHQKVSPETSDPKYEGTQPPYNPNVPSSATPYNPNLPSGATPYNPNVPSGATP